MDAKKSQKNLSKTSFVNTDEGLSFSDYFDDSIPYEVKPVPCLRPMEEDDYPIQTKSQEAGLWESYLDRSYDQFWLDPSGKFHATKSHSGWVKMYFGLQGIEIADQDTAYMAAFKKGYIRVSLNRSERTLHFQYGDRGSIMTKPNHKQMAALKDAAIENGWFLYDDIRNSSVELFEALMLEDVVRNALNYWLDPNGKFHRCGFGHVEWARNFLLNKAIRFDPEDSSSVYDEMFALKWIRVKVRDDRIYFEYGDHPLTNVQLRQLRDTAIESNMKLVDAKSQYKELDLLQERMLPDNASYWLDPNGTLHDVGYEGHQPFAAHYLSSIGHKVGMNGYYEAMYSKGWVRVYVDEDVHIAHNPSREPNNAQWRQLRDSAAESRKEIFDDTTNRPVELQEGKDCRTLFIESMMPDDMETFKSHLAQLFAFLQKELQLKTVPKVKLVSDEKNADKVLGKTAYYDPDQQLVVLYTTNRHQKDILRSFAHEVIHHWQHENQQLNKDEANEDANKDPQYAQNDPWLRQMEKQAYLLGNILFRDWEDQKKATDRKSQKKMVEDKDLQAKKIEALVNNGHGKWVGSCGHVIKQCRCKHGAELTFKTLSPCPKCMKEQHGKGNVQHDTHTPIMKNYHPSHPYRKHTEGPPPSPESIKEKTYLIGKEYPPKKTDYSG